MNLSDLETQYLDVAPRAERFLKGVQGQLLQLIREEGIALGVPLEARVKSFESIAAKVERRSLDLASIDDVTDLIGFRIITLFSRDVARIQSLLQSNFDVQEVEDTSLRLQTAQFGYQSLHFHTKLLNEWFRVPTFKGLDGMSCEVQVRTLAQHIWAAASHTLQYKKETSVPPPVRRSIHRVAALLETIDLEFERALEERDEYLKGAADLEPSTRLNVDLLRSTMDDFWPSKNKTGSEVDDTAQLLIELQDFDVTTTRKLRAILKKHEKSTLDEDSKTVAVRRRDGSLLGTTQERLDLGVYFTHCGLTRGAMWREFGDKWKDYHDADKREETDEESTETPS